MNRYGTPQTATFARLPVFRPVVWGVLAICCCWVTGCKSQAADANAAISPPALGDANAEARIIKLIEETCQLPAVPKPSGQEPAWSDASGGLKARIVYVGEGTYNGYVVVVELKNVSDKPLVVPMGHRAELSRAGLFEVHARAGTGAWEHVDGIDSNCEVRPKGVGPTATLPPGQEAVACVTESRLEVKMAKASEVKVVVRQADDATAPAGGWRGVLETPPAPAHWEAKDVDSLAGAMAFPAVFPNLSRYGFMGGNMSLGESQLRQLEISNWELLKATRVFDPAGVRAEFERRMTAEPDPAMKLLLAAEAVERGSKVAARCLLEGLKDSEYDAALNVQSALNRLMYRFDQNQPVWLVAMVEEALSDNREVMRREKDEKFRFFGYECARNPQEVRREKTNKVRLAGFKVSRLAAEDSGLSRALGNVKCRDSVPLLIEQVRKTHRQESIETLGLIGDKRAVPVLLEELKANCGKAEYRQNFGLGPPSFTAPMHALANLKAAEAVDTLMDYMQFPDVIEALERIGDRRVVPALQEIVQADGKLIRDGKNLEPDLAGERLIKAKIALESLNESDPVGRLCELLNDKSFGEFDRCDVVSRLGKRLDPRAIPFLIRAIKTDPSGTVILNSITDLSAFKYKAAAEGLIDCFDADFKGKHGWKVVNKPEMFHEHIAKSLRELTGRNLGADKKQWEDWWKAEGQFDKNLK